MDNLAFFDDSVLYNDTTKNGGKTDDEGVHLDTEEKDELQADKINETIIVRKRETSHQSDHYLHEISQDQHTDPEKSHGDNEYIARPKTNTESPVLRENRITVDNGGNEPKGDSFKDDIKADSEDAHIPVQDAASTPTKRRVRRKKRSDARNTIASEDEIERPRRLKKKKRKPRDLSTEPDNLLHPTEIKTDTPSCDRLGSGVNDSDHLHSNGHVKKTPSVPNASTVYGSSEKRIQARTIDIFTVQGAGNKNSNDVPNTALHTAGQSVLREKRKKTKKVHGLKKTRAAVGVLPSEVQTQSTETNGQQADDVKTADVGQVRDSSKLIADDTKATTTFPEPLRLCKLITAYPVISFLTISLLHIAVFATTAGLVFNGYDVFPLVFDTLPLYIYEDVHLKELTWKEKNKIGGMVWRPVYGANIATGTRSEVKDSVEIIFERPGVNLLDKHHLEWLKRVEDRLFKNQLFQDEFCLVDYNRDCVKPQSILRFFDGTYSDVDPVFSDPDFSNVAEVIYKANMYNETRSYLQLFMGKSSVITRNSSVTTITRSVFLVGWPLGIVAMGGRVVWGNYETLTNFLADVFRPEIEYIRDEILADFIDVYYISKALYEHDLVAQALKDVMLAIGSVSFIFVFMCFQTASIVVTTLSVLSIVSSFLLTNLIYRYVFQYVYFGFFHVIIMFLILGIGADDLFVFYDTWRLTGKKKYPSDAHRLSDCYRRAAKTTFVTSITTMMAFLVSGLSPLLPVQTFGIFAGVLVAINYIWVIIYFPTVIIIHHAKVKPVWNRFIKLILSPCSSNKVVSTQSRRKSVTSAISSEASSTRVLIDNKSNSTIDEEVPKDNNKTKESLNDLNGIHFTSEKHRKGEVKLDLRESEVQAIRSTLSARKEQRARRGFEDRNRVVRFLKNSFFYFMTNRVVKIVVPLLLLAVSIFFVHRATLIEPDTQQLRLFRDGHNYAQATERHYNAFIRNDDAEYQQVYLVWGLLPADISDCNTKSGQYCFGKPQVDDSFDMNTPEAQTAFKNLCKVLDTIPDSLVRSLHIRRDDISGKPEISCFTSPMENYFEKEAAITSISGVRKYPDDFKIALPVHPGNVTTLMSHESSIYRYSLSDDFNNYFEIPVDYWLTNGYTLSPTADYFLYNDLLVGQRTPDSRGAYYSSSGLHYGTRLLYMAVEINTTMNLYQLGYNEGLPIFRNWEDLMADINKGFPKPLQRGMQVAETLWHWLHVQETLANSAYMGILIGLTTALPILILTTSNVIIGTLATVTIGLVTACVVGLIPLVGWKLGVLESINLCMVVGLSVDYVVHLAEAYRMSESEKRLDRVRSMLESIGLSVVSGAITTIGAAIFMLFAEIRFFYQFGVFIISTVGISLVFSLLGYTTFMSLCGPENNFGSLKAVGLATIRYCKVNPKHKSSCPCASPAVILDRLYDRISYGKDTNKELEHNAQQLTHR